MSIVTLQRRTTKARRRKLGHGGTENVLVDRILLGGQALMGASEFAAAIGDPMWPSRPVLAGPHARLLRANAVRELDERDILGSDYGQLARRCLALTGRFGAATDEAGVVALAQDYLRCNSAYAAGPIFPRPRGQERGESIRVAPIRGSDCFQLIDGHHRVAAYAVSGAATVPARVSRLSVSTPLQDALHRMSGSGGADELYQPIESPEVATWPAVRGCTDRLEKMDLFLGSHGIAPGFTSHLDVASCYGWFVAGMSSFGYRSEGVDPDPLAPEVGQHAYGLARAEVHTSEVVPFLREASLRAAGSGRRWDVVSCFSLLHHFALGRGKVSAQRLVELLDEVTGSVLFLDTGQAHERWFRNSLAVWDSDYVREFLLEYTTFDEVVDLGPDHDDRPPYSGNHGRHLFACVRKR
ncbi:MAG: hypothetical protein L0H93_11180 [Nocardioides sp.]|nr:hypothetical protein [Nocardioides sp.]